MMRRHTNMCDMLYWTCRLLSYEQKEEESWHELQAQCLGDVVAEGKAIYDATLETYTSLRSITVRLVSALVEDEGTAVSSDTTPSPTTHPVLQAIIYQSDQDKAMIMGRYHRHSQDVLGRIDSAFGGMATQGNNLGYQVESMIEEEVKRLMSWSQSEWGVVEGYREGEDTAMVDMVKALIQEENAQLKETLIELRAVVRGLSSSSIRSCSARLGFMVEGRCLEGDEVSPAQAQHSMLYSRLTLKRAEVSPIMSRRGSKKYQLVLKIAVLWRGITLDWQRIQGLFNKRIEMFDRDLDDWQYIRSERHHENKKGKEESIKQRWHTEAQATLGASLGGEKVEYHDWAHSLTDYVNTSGTILEECLQRTHTRLTTFLSQALDHFTASRGNMLRQMEQSQEAFAQQLEALQETHASHVAFQSIAQGIRDDASRSHRENLVVVAETIQSKVQEWTQTITSYTADLGDKLQVASTDYETKISMAVAEGSCVSLEDLKVIRDEYQGIVTGAGEKCWEEADGCVTRLWEQDVTGYYNESLVSLVGEVNKVMDGRVMEVVERSVQESKGADITLEQDFASLLHGLDRDSQRLRMEQVQAFVQVFKVSRIQGGRIGPVS